jgi:archaellum component FlaC
MTTEKKIEKIKDALTKAVTQRQIERALAHLGPAKTHVHNAIYDLGKEGDGVEQFLFEAREAINYLEGAISAVTATP